MSTGVIAALQYLTAATFAIIGVTAHLRGAAAQRAAEAEVVRQGFAREVLTRHRVRIEESFAELMLPLGIAVILAVLATLNLAGSGRTATWILQPILLLAGGYITTSQVFVQQSVAAAFRRSEDADARAVDTQAVLDAAFAEFPQWLRALVVTRFVLVTFGSAVVLVLLAVG